ncbi:MAG: hypothetical protein M3474_04120 [Actinomycetota bacterium]|nr:hypothetical protein [Actinomycetota bacterium]
MALTWRLHEESAEEGWHRPDLWRAHRAAGGFAATPAGAADNAHDTSNDEVGVFLESARSVNPREGRVTRPLFRGTYRGQTVRYIVHRVFQ